MSKFGLTKNSRLMAAAVKSKYLFAAITVLVCLLRADIYSQEHGGEGAESGKKTTDVYLGVVKKVVTPGRVSEEIFESNKSVSVIDEKKIARDNSRTVPDAVTGQVGVWIPKTTHGHGTPGIRGFLGRENLILIDGVRLNNSTFRSGNNQYLNTIDVSQIDDIEIVRGPGSVLYGSDALGGVINIITKNVTDFSNKFSMERKVSGSFNSSDNGFKTSIGASGNIDKLGYIIGAGYKKFGDLHAGGDAGVEKPTGYSEAAGNLKLNYSINPVASVNFLYQHSGQNDVPRYDKYLGAREWPTGSYDKFLYDPQGRDLWILEYDNKETNYFIDSVKTNISFQRQKEGIASHVSGSKYRMENLDETGTMGCGFQLGSKISDKHALVYGAEYYRDDVKSGLAYVYTSSGARTDMPLKSTFPDGSEYDTLGAYLQDKISLGDKMSLILGGRYSRYSLESTLRNAPLAGSFSQSFELLTGSLGMSYKLGGNYNFIANISQGFRAPNLSDTVVLQTTNQGIDVPNYDLGPEKSVNYEVGLKKAGRLSGSVSVYDSEVKDLIDRKKGTYEGKTFYDYDGYGVKDAKEPDVYQKFNIGNARIKGAEIESDWLFLCGFSVFGNLSWIFGENLTGSEPLSYIPPVNGIAGFRWKGTGARSCWAETGVNFAGKQSRLSTRDKSDPRIQPGGTPGWASWNVKGGFDIFQGMAVSLGVENVLDKLYRIHCSGVDAPGRSFLAGFEFKF